MEDLFLDYRKNSRGCLQDSIARIHPKIVIGAGPQLDLFNCHMHHISHVINCAGEETCPEHMKQHFLETDRYVCINAEDTEEVKITKWYPEFKDVMNKFLRDPECTTVFVHCRMGMNRSAFLALMYVCDRFQYNFDKTCKAIITQRPCALQNMVFYKQVQQYIKKNS